MKNIFLSALLLCLFVSSCKSDKETVKNTTSNTNKIEEVVPEKERTETYQIYMVTVDNLRFREGAKKSTKVLGKLKEGSLVYSNGTHSDFTEQVELRGKKYDRPYQEITFEGNKGWAYQGGLFKIYDSGEEDSFTADLDNFALRFKKSKKTLLEKGEEILKVLRQEKSGSTEWNDMMYIMAEHNFNKILEDKALYEPFEDREWTPEEYSSAQFKSYDMQSNQFSKSYAKAGFKFAAGVGALYPVIDPMAIRNSITGPFSAGMQEYLAIRDIDSKVKMFSEGSIICPMSSIVDYVVISEKYINDYPHALGVDKAKEEVEYLNSVLLKGSSNSPAINYETKQLNPEWMTAWQRYVDTNPNGLIIDEVKSSIEKYK